MLALFSRNSRIRFSKIISFLANFHVVGNLKSTETVTRSVRTNHLKESLCKFLLVIGKEIGIQNDTIHSITTLCF